MRLLNTRTQQFRELSSNDSLDYAILSHRWLEGEEVSYQEFLLLTAGDDLIGTSTALYRRSALEQKRSSSGFRKIERACQRAVADGLGWIWIDACCIDKSSSAELSEAINSMWLWYKMSKICYAYLADVDCEDGLTSESSQKSFQNSRWWSRVSIPSLSPMKILYRIDVQIIRCRPELMRSSGMDFTRATCPETSRLLRQKVVPN